MDLRKKGMKALITVEASFVIVLTIIVMGIIVSLWIYKFQECWYTQSVSECLLTGSNMAVLHEKDYIKDVQQKWKKVKEENYLVPEALMVQIDDENDKISMNVSGKTLIWGYNNSLQLDIKCETGIVKPVIYIRKVARLKEAVEE